MSNSVTIPVVYVPGIPGPTGPPSTTGPITVIVAGATTALTRAVSQRVAIATNGAAAVAVFPLAPQDQDAIWVHTSGTTVANPATLNPNGAHIEDPYATPGSIVTSPVSMGVNPAVSALYIYEASGTLWRLWQ